MSRILLTAILLVALHHGPVHAQAFQAGDNAIGVGVGVGGYYNFHPYTGVRPSIGLFYDRGTGVPVGPGVLGIGGYFSYTNRRSTPYWTGYRSELDIIYHYWSLGLRGTYHWNSWHKVENWDVYAGVGIGVTAESWSDRTDYGTYIGDRYSYSPRGRLRSSLFVGTRYYFTDFLGVFAEVGYDTAFLTGGLQLKF
ncbi:MAG: hypothetical protein IPM49_13720 [Flavobacteriales bacterium]|nr:hypothetical protein [Flavobacteriales bacterium]